MYLVSNTMLHDAVTITVIGCGGTGSLVSEGLCRLLVDRPEARIVLVDYDRVEAHNLRRQAFYTADLGRFKSQALAERLSRAYRREISYSTIPWTSQVYAEIYARSWGAGMYEVGRGIIIGCVDNALARAVIQESMLQRVGGMDGVWWLDAGNGRDSGQVLLGNVSVEKLSHAFDLGLETVLQLPLPTVQQPDLLVPASGEGALPDCAQAVQEGDQSPTINQAMATLVVEYVRRLLQGTLPWMATYLDLFSGSMTSVPATPEAVAKLTGKRVVEMSFRSPNTGKRCPHCGLMHEREETHGRTPI